MDRRAEILDELLVLRCLDGSGEAFRLLVERWQPRLWRHARRLTGRDDAAWDVLQEAWIAIARDLARLADPGAFRRWAYRIVTRRAADWRRRRRPDEERAEPDAVDALPARGSAEGAADGRAALVERLRSALRRLPGEQRALLSLAYLEGFAAWEIAEVLDVPEGTVRSRLHTARQRLRDILERTTE